jgi:hypothetical protein
MHSLSTKLLLTNPIWLLISMSSCSFSSKTCKKLLSKAMKERYDVIIVPGVPYKNEWSRTMKARVYWSKFLFDQGIAKNILFSGSSVYTPYTESKIMALYGEAIGIPKDSILTETRAEHSTENVYYSYKMAKKLHFNRIALASDPFQAKLLGKFIRKKLNGDVDLIPIVFDSLRAMEPYMTNPVIDAQQAYNKDFIPISKRESLWKRLKGTIGININKNIDD